MTQSGLFFGGLPTGPDVERLMKEISATPGTSATYEQLLEILGGDVSAARLRTVLARWRRRLMNEMGLQTKCAGGAVHFLTADGAQDKARGGMVRLGRASGRLVRDVGLIRPEELTSEERRRLHRLQAQEARAILEAVRESTRRLVEPARRRGDAVRLADEQALKL